MQRLSQGALAGLAPSGSELWLDGGHNADGGRAIANALADLEERVSRPLVLVVGMLASKDCEGFLRNFAGLARRIVAIPIPDQENSLPPTPFATWRARSASRRRKAALAICASAARAALITGSLTRGACCRTARSLMTGSLYLGRRGAHLPTRSR